MDLRLRTIQALKEGADPAVVLLLDWLVDDLSRAERQALGEAFDVDQAVLELRQELDLATREAQSLRQVESDLRELLDGTEKQHRIDLARLHAEISEKNISIGRLESKLRVRDEAHARTCDELRAALERIDELTAKGDDRSAAEQCPETVQENQQPARRRPELPIRGPVETIEQRVLRLFAKHGTWQKVKQSMQGQKVTSEQIRQILRQHGQDVPEPIPRAERAKLASKGTRKAPRIDSEKLKRAAQMLRDGTPYLEVMKTVRLNAAGMGQAKRLSVEPAPKTAIQEVEPEPAETFQPGQEALADKQAGNAAAAASSGRGLVESDAESGGAAETSGIRGDHDSAASNGRGDRAAGAVIDTVEPIDLERKEQRMKDGIAQLLAQNPPLDLPITPHVVIQALRAFADGHQIATIRRDVIVDRVDRDALRGQDEYFEEWLYGHARCLRALDRESQREYYAQLLTSLGSAKKRGRAA